MVKSNKKMSVVSSESEARSEGWGSGRQFLIGVLVVVFAIALINVLNIKKQNSMIGDEFSDGSAGSSLTGAVPGDAGTILWGDDPGEKCKRTSWQGGYTYKLTRNFGYYDLDSTTKSCFLINAQNVVLDCDGHTISNAGFPVPQTGSKGIEITSNGVVVKNCKAISNFDNGIYLLKANTYLDNVQSLSNTITKNNVGINFGKFVRYTTVDNNEITSNADTGIKFVGGNNNNIVRNTISCRNTNYDVGFFCAGNYPCKYTSGTGNYFSKIKPDDGSSPDVWPQLGTHYQDCSKVQCNNGIDDDGDIKIDYTTNSAYTGDSKCIDTKDLDESPKDNCVDTDGGINQLVAGSVSGWNNDATFGPYADYCLDSTRLNEYYCGDKFKDYDWFSQEIGCYNATIGGHCTKGACVYP